MTVRKPKPPGESMFRDGMTVNHSNPSSKGKNFMNFSTYGRSDAAMAASKKKNTRAEFEASKVEKGALVEHIKAASAKAGVNVKDVLGYKPPKTLQVAKPAPTPNFNKSSIPMVGVAREAAIKTGKPVIPGRPMVTKLTGGVQGQIAAQKKPLIPMVNAGVVAKAMVDGEWQPNGQAESTHQKILKQHGAKDLKEAVKNIQDKKKVTKAEWGNTGKSWAGIKVNPANKPGVIRHDGGTSPSNPPTKVTKAESPAAKPITKSPSSGPAGKVSTPKPTSNLAPRAPKL
jgi:hypothetical protein